MAHGTTEGIPPRAYIASARSHVISATALIRAGQHDHASFHLITALEELSRAYVEQVVVSGEFKGLKWDGKPVLGQVSGARKDHEFKIPSGMLVVALRALKLYEAEIQLTSPSVPPDARARLAAKLGSEIAWLAGLFGTVNGIRELSIYAGWDHSESPRPTVDWQRVAAVLSPIVGRELEFQAFLLDHPLTPEQLAEARTEFIELAKRREEVRE